ncbi:hypothetical protein AWB69_06541 [Caballeronia udeis]|uniref:Uncharacterized protein n=1 Tax=Caballeronia udeis TaxID=1232866 RepID=A0A158IRX7_9BURK|nr:hypothetical protein AWB69_06541 [Caballeronia udeis]
MQMPKMINPALMLWVESFIQPSTYVLAKPPRFAIEQAAADRALRPGVFLWSKALRRAS